MNDKVQAAAEMRLAIQMFAQTVTEDDKALKIKSVYPRWDEVIGEEVTEGFKFRYGDDLFKVIQPELTIEGHRIPDQGNESLYTKIDETHAGTVNDPIPYDGNMEIFSGKYYIQNGVIYECIRDSDTPLYHDLASLVGIYVNVYATE